MFTLSFLRTAYNEREKDLGEMMGHLAGQRLLEFTEKTRLRQVSPTILRELLNGMIDILRKRVRDDPGNATDEEVLYRALQNLGLLQTDLGEIDAALLTLTEAAETNDRHALLRKGIFERPGGEDPKTRYGLELFYHQNERDRMLNFQRIGRLQIRKNEPEAARTSYERAPEISQYFLKRYPESELAATDMAMNLYSLGDLSLGENEFETAVEQFGAELTGVVKVADRKSSPLLLELTIAGCLGLARANTRSFHLKPVVQQYGTAKFRGFLIGGTLIASSPEALDESANVLQKIAFRNDQPSLVCVPGTNDGLQPGTTFGILGSAASVKPGSRVRASSGVSSGLLVKRVEPHYPEAARKDQIEGTIILSASISELGNVETVELVSGDRTLASAAIEAVKQWKYKPYLLNGTSMTMLTQIVVDFKLPAN